MWEVQRSKDDQDVHKMRLFENNDPLRYEDVILYWRENHKFTSFYISVLTESPFEAFFWEHPPVTRSNIQQPYEFVLVNSPQLARASADLLPFQEKFESLPPGKEVIAFENLGGDAELIVPCPIAAQTAYAHFGSFIRHAPEKQKHDLFMTLADTLRKRISNRPTWVSTSGLGVYWLHIRLDSSPKYYSYQSYCHYVE